MKNKLFGFFFLICLLTFIYCIPVLNLANDVRKNVVIRDTKQNQQAQINEKILICGVAKKIAKAVPTTISLVNDLGSRFLDYKVIIYENNSADNTVELLNAWAKNDPHVIFMTEKLSSSRFKKESDMQIVHRIEKLARARNIVLDIASRPCFDDHKYIIWMDLDFIEPWSVDAVVETIINPEHDFDAVFAGSNYDTFALRTSKWPIGFELLGQSFTDTYGQIMYHGFDLKESDSWEKVYSAFGGIGIYKRDAIIGSRYSAIVTKDLDDCITHWLKNSENIDPTFQSAYTAMLSSKSIFPIESLLLDRASKFPEVFGAKPKNFQNIYFSCTPNSTYPWTCEHVTLHASMAKQGFDRLYVNPKIKCAWTGE